MERLADVILGYPHVANQYETKQVHVHHLEYRIRVSLPFCVNVGQVLERGRDVGSVGDDARRLGVTVGRRIAAGSNASAFQLCISRLAANMVGIVAVFSMPMMVRMAPSARLSSTAYRDAPVRY